jgi:hypothetical protein
MPAYLQGSDLAAFGVSNATGAQITAASALIDAHLARREGLLYGVDGNGAPAYMLGLSPSITLALTTAIAPGSAVQATVTGPAAMLRPGSVLIADQASPSITEALVVQSVLNQTVTFTNVQFAHAAGAQLLDGLVITEQRTMPQDRPITQVSRTPIVAALSGVGRYGYQRRGDDGFGNMDTYNLLAVMSKFGGPPAWEPFTLQSNSIDPQTGQLWIPAGVLLAYYTEVRVSYIAGWTYANLPYEIKQACANIINNQAALQGIPGSIQKAQTGAGSLTRFAGAGGVQPSAAIDADTAALLAPYKARMFV